MGDPDKRDVTRNAFIAGWAGVLPSEVQFRLAFIGLFVAVALLDADRASSQSGPASSAPLHSYATLTIAVNSETAMEHLSRGNGFAAAGDLDAAISDSRVPLRIKPDFFEAHANLANALKAKGDLDSAIVEYRIALRINPDYSEPHYSLANALRAKGDAEGAISEYRAA